MTAFDKKAGKAAADFATGAAHSVVDEAMNIASMLPWGDAATEGYYHGTGGASPAALSAAFGHWAEDHHDQTPASPTDQQSKAFAKSDWPHHPATDHLVGPEDQRTKVPEAPHQQVAGFMNFLNYDPEWASKAPPEDTKLDLSTPEARIKSLDQLTQNRTDSEGGEVMCAASSLVGGAVLGQGTDGIKKLMTGIDNNLSKENRARLEAKDKDGHGEGTLARLREKMAAGEPLTNADMHQLQADVYLSLQDVNTKALAAKGKVPENPGFDSATIDTFLKNSPEMDEMMRENHMGIAGIDGNGTGQAHAVLAIRQPGAEGGDANAANAAVYDPYARKHGQIVTDQGSLTEIRLAEKHREDGKEWFSQ